MPNLADLLGDPTGPNPTLADLRLGVRNAPGPNGPMPSNEEIAAYLSKVGQIYPPLYPVNPAGWDAFLENGPLSQNVDDRRPQRFSDVPNWRGRELGAEREFGGSTVAPGRNPPPPLRDRWPALPMSQNIEDRRNERVSLLDDLVSKLSGGLFNTETFAKAWAGRNEPIDRFGKMPTLTTLDPLARDAGYNDIPVYPSRLNLPWWQR